MVVLLQHTAPLTLQGFSFNTVCSKLSCFYNTLHQIVMEKRDLEALKHYSEHKLFRKWVCKHSILLYERKSKAI